MSPLLVTAALIRNGNRILVTRRPDHCRHGGLWEFPGGKMETGESPDGALRRELLEELDLPVAVEGIFDVVFHRYPWGAVLILVYHCRPEHFRIRNLQVAEHRWCRASEMADLPFLPADIPLVNRLRELEEG